MTERRKERGKKRKIKFITQSQEFERLDDWNKKGENEHAIEML